MADSVGCPPPDSVPDGPGDPEVGDPDGAGDWGDPDCGDPDCVPDCGGPVEEPVGGGGDCGGWLRKIKIAMSTARAASSTIRSHDTKIVRQPARSKRPGQGNGHRRARPGRTLSIDRKSVV